MLGTVKITVWIGYFQNILPQPQMLCSNVAPVCHQVSTSCFMRQRQQRQVSLNSLAPGRSGFNFKCAIFNLVLLIGIFRSFYDNALRWMSWDLSEDKSTLVQVMARCRQALQCVLFMMTVWVVQPKSIKILLVEAIYYFATHTCCRL